MIHIGGKISNFLNLNFRNFFNLIQFRLCDVVESQIVDGGLCSIDCKLQSKLNLTIVNLSADLMQSVSRLFVCVCVKIGFKKTA